MRFIERVRQVRVEARAYVILAAIKRQWHDHLGSWGDIGVYPESWRLSGEMKLPGLDVAHAAKLCRFVEAALTREGLPLAVRLECDPTGISWQYQMLATAC